MSAPVYHSKSEAILESLRDLIISGEVLPGEPLRQRDLAERFNVSQTPVREALRRLESEGLVPGRPSPWIAGGEHQRRG
jgi:DNA-binding GntR family transcriptional regulator